MRVYRLGSVILIISVLLGDSFAGMASRAVAVSLTASVAPVIRLQAAGATAIGSTVTILSDNQNGFTAAFVVTGDDTALIEIPVTLQSNVNDVLLRATFDTIASGYISLDGSALANSNVVSRPTPLATNLIFAVACNLVRHPAVTVGRPLPATVSIAIPPGVVPQGQRVTAQITVEPLHH
jgi:hypothetical protein